MQRLGYTLTYTGRYSLHARAKGCGYNADFWLDNVKYTGIYKV